MNIHRLIYPYPPILDTLSLTLPDIGEVKLYIRIGAEPNQTKKGYYYYGVQANF
jgi:hypothetical protein